MDNSSFLALLSVVIAALITAAGTVLAAYIGKDRTSSSDLQKGTVLKPPGYEPPARKFWSRRSFVILVSLILLTAVTRWILGMYSLANQDKETINFTSDRDPTLLHPDLGWDAGSSETNSYIVDADTLTIVAGPGSWPNFPMINYKQPLRGDFRIQIKISFTPDAATLTTAQMAGILVRPANSRLVQGDESFPRDWVFASKYVTDNGSLFACPRSNTRYLSETIFVSIEKVSDSWRCSYSSNGKNWSYLSVNADTEQLANKDMTISLFAYSQTGNAIAAQFSDWKINRDENR